MRIKGQNIGQALGVLLHHYATEAHYHADVDAWHAPSECHGDVSRGEAKRLRQVRRQIKAITGLRWPAFVAEVSKRTGQGSKLLYLGCQQLGALRATPANVARYPMLFGGA